jgi:membrane protease YdiL (CAAX protease family)
MNTMAEEIPGNRIGLFGMLLRGFLFLLFIRYCGGFFGWLLNEVAGIFAAAALSIFIAAALASWFVVRTFERGRLEDIGMGWSQRSLWHLWIGFAGGACAGLVAMLAPVGMRLAEIVPTTDPAAAFTPGKLIFVTVVLLFGAVGEEMMFRGYAFQLLMRAYGPWWVIPPFAALFAWAHAANPGVNWLGILNTGLWGLIFAYAFYRSGDLWLPIGLHFGWNWVLPLFGVNLSGFTMGLSGHTLRWKAGPLWSGGDYGVEASLLTSVCASVLLLWLWRARLERQTAPLLADSAPPPPEQRQDTGKE